MKRTISLAFCFALFVIPGLAQDWRQIVPLKTKCEDLKKILSVKECKFPVSNYEFEEYKININFGNQFYKLVVVSKDTVESAMIMLKKGIAIKDFETNLSDYKISEPDYPALIYRNEKKGIEFETQKIKGIELVFSIVLFPPELEKNGK